MLILELRSEADRPVTERTTGASEGNLLEVVRRLELWLVDHDSGHLAGMARSVVDGWYLDSPLAADVIGIVRAVERGQRVPPLSARRLPVAAPAATPDFSDEFASNPASTPIGAALAGTARALLEYARTTLGDVTERFALGPVIYEVRSDGAPAGGQFDLAPLIEGAEGLRKADGYLSKQNLEIWLELSAPVDGEVWVFVADGADTQYAQGSDDEGALYFTLAYAHLEAPDTVLVVERAP